MSSYLSQTFWSLFWKSLLAVLVVILIAGLTTPLTFRHGKKAEQTEAVSNARQIGLALFEFHEEYGQMPDAGTIEKVRQKSGTDLKLGTKSSNDFFRQLMASGIAQSENMFYAKIVGTHKPDHIFAGAKALEKGECGFTYFTCATKGCNPSRPLAATPMIPGTDRFDPKPFDGKAVILRADNSATWVPILIRDGHATVNGQNLMDPANPIWEG